MVSKLYINAEFLLRSLESPPFWRGPFYAYVNTSFTFCRITPMEFVVSSTQLPNAKRCLNEIPVCHLIPVSFPPFMDCINPRCLLFMMFCDIVKSLYIFYILSFVTEVICIRLNFSFVFGIIRPAIINRGTPQ